MPFSAPLPQSDRKQHLSVVAATHRHSTCSRTWKHAWMPSSFDLYSIANAVVTTTIQLPFDSRSHAFQTADESYSFIHLFICSEWQVQIRHCVTQCEPDSKAQKLTLQLPFRLTTITFLKILKINAPCLKKVGHFNFYDNFNNRGPIFTFFSLLN